MRIFLWKKKTGKRDQTYSDFPAPFAGDKQVARRARSGYAEGADDCYVHYLHYSEHRWLVGDVDPNNSNAEMYVKVPTEIGPSDGQDWQSNNITHLWKKQSLTWFDLVSLYFENMRMCQ